MVVPADGVETDIGAFLFSIRGIANNMIVEIVLPEVAGQ
jgi:hypothetical protein